jgi:formylglycine-generating enzyme required for sulfatase activity
MLALAGELTKSEGPGANRLLTRLQAERRGPEIAQRRDEPRGDVWTNPQDGKEMIHIPAGEFLYGDEKKKIELPEFRIDRTPVTNAEYAGFVAATGHKPPEHWKGKVPPEKVAHHPVVNVSWDDAVAYARWAGKRLPTEKEWEKAARATDGREYPWGDWEENRCNTKEAGVGGTTPVGRYSPGGDSPFGCVDMAGNVWEWTVVEEGDPYVVRASRRLLPGPDQTWTVVEEGDPYVVRGGSWLNGRDLARCAARDSFFPHVSLFSLGVIGFRCVSPV